MATYQVTTVVWFTTEVEADSESEAEQYGWNYEDFLYNAEVQEIVVYEYPEGEEPESEVE